MHPFFKFSGVIILSVLLIVGGFHYMLTSEQKQLFITTPFNVHFFSVLLVIPCYLMGGVELGYLYNKISKIKLSNYDKITLPFVINLWGFIIPFQGSFLYTITYIYSKYKKTLQESVFIYLISFSITMAFTGLIGVLFFLFSEFTLSVVFLGVCVLLLLNPVLCYAALTMVNRTKLIHSNLATKLKLKTFNLDQIDRKMVLYLFLIKVVLTAFTVLWSYWLSVSFDIVFSIIQLVLISLLMNLTLLVKITPGNIGISQFASGGVAVLVGGTMEDGFLLSTVQYLSIIIVAIIFGGIFSIINAKHFSFRLFKIKYLNTERMGGK